MIVISPKYLKGAGHAADHIHHAWIVARCLMMIDHMQSCHMIKGRDEAAFYHMRYHGSLIKMNR